MADAAVKDPPAKEAVHLTPQQQAREKIQDKSPKPGERDTVMEGLVADFKAKGSSLIKGSEASKTEDKPVQTVGSAPVGDTDLTKLPTVEEVQAKLTATQEAMQKRIDELTAKLKAEPPKEEKKEPKTIKDLSDIQLLEMLEAAEERRYGATKDELGDIVPGDRRQNLSIAEAVREERLRRKLESEQKPAREEQELYAAHAKSVNEAATKYQKFLYNKDADGKLIFDQNLPVAKRATELLQEWAKDPGLARHPDLPRIAVEVAIGQVSSTADFENLKRIHRLEIENEKLKAQGRMDTGRPGGPAKTKKDEDKDETPQSIIAQRVSEGNQRRGILARPRA